VLTFDYNPEWLLAYRTDTLTCIFKLFPYLVSDYFCFLVVALGYWLRPHKKLFIALGYLIPVTTISNYLLKNLFAIPRPSSIYHLVPVHDFYGFPSGDVMLASVFWGMVFCATKSWGLRILCASIVISIMASRIYLGVHSPYDVCGGVFFGLIIVALWNSNRTQANVSEWYEEHPQTFWIIYVSLIIIALEPNGTTLPPVVMMSIGALLGYGLSLSSIGKTLHEPDTSVPLKETSLKKWIAIGLSSVILVVIAKVIPMPKDYPMLANLLNFPKYALIIYLTYSVLPRAQRWYCGINGPSQQ